MDIPRVKYQRQDEEWGTVECVLSFLWNDEGPQTPTYTEYVRGRIVTFYGLQYPDTNDKAAEALAHGANAADVQRWLEKANHSRPVPSYVVPYRVSPPRGLR